MIAEKRKISFFFSFFRETEGSRLVVQVVHDLQLSSEPV